MKQRIKHILKFLCIAAAVAFVLFGIVTWLVFERKDDWLLRRIQSFADESQSGQLTIGSIDLKFFKNFPNITIELDSIRYYEHWDSLRESKEQPILHADQLFIALKLLPLMQDELDISVVSISQAQVNIIEYQNGKLNIDLALSPPAKAKPTSVPDPVDTNPGVTNPVATELVPSPPVKITKTNPQPSSEGQPGIRVDLEHISLDDILVTWNKLNNRNPSVILMKTADITLFRDQTGMSTKLTSQHEIQKLYFNGVKLPPGDASLIGNVRYENDKQQLILQSGEIKYNAFSATVGGTLSLQKDLMLDLQVDASSNDLALLSRLFKPAVIRQNPGLLKKGNLYVKGRVFGELKKQPPQFNISFGVRKLDMRLPKKLGTFEDVGFDGSFASGNAADYSRASLAIRNLRGKFPDGFLKGQISVNNFVDPYLKYNLNAQLKLDGYDEIFELNSLKNLRGTVSLEANFDGPLKMIKGHTMDSSRSSTLTLNDLSFVVTKTGQRVSGLSGKIENSNNQAALQDLSFKYGDNDLMLNAKIDNLYYSIFNREQDITASGNVRSKQLYTKDFIPDTLRTAHIKDRVSNLSFDFKVKTSANLLEPSFMPDIVFDIQNFSAQLEKLPDIRLLNVGGRFSETVSGLKLDLTNFHANMPHGQLDVTGDLLIPEKQNWVLNVHLNANKFPWTYVNELVAEIKDGAEPSAKNLPLTQMEIVTADLDLSASIITYPFDINSLDVRDSRIAYSFADSKTMSVDKLNLSLEHLNFMHPKNSGSLTGLISTKGTAQLNQLSIPGFNKVDIKLDVSGKDDTLNIDFSSTTQIARGEKGHLLMDISKKEPGYHLQYFVNGASLEYFVNKYYKKNFMKGDIDYMLDLQTAGTTWAKAKQNLIGDIEITGDSLHLNGLDIDGILKKFRKSQNFNLTDVGAVLIAGPLGLAVTKGSSFISLATFNHDSSQHTMIKTLLAKWKIENHLLTTEDVAFSTRSNRISFIGAIDFGLDSIPGLTIAVVDKNGCSLMDQKLYGKTNALQKGKLNITKTLLGSVINFAHAVVGKDCKPLYTGKVKDPFADR